MEAVFEYPQSVDGRHPSPGGEVTWTRDGQTNGNDDSGFHCRGPTVAHVFCQALHPMTAKLTCVELSLGASHLAECHTWLIFFILPNPRGDTDGQMSLSSVELPDPQACIAPL